MGVGVSFQYSRIRAGNQRRKRPTGAKKPLRRGPGRRENGNGQARTVSGKQPFDAQEQRLFVFFLDLPDGGGARIRILIRSGARDEVLFRRGGSVVE
jgi:hypothetical protein